MDNAGGKTLTFNFEGFYVGYYGAAVSKDYVNWEWQNETGVHSKNSFTYTFTESENKVYFAHDMLYRPERLFEFTHRRGIYTDTLCKSEKGRDIPYIKMGGGSRKIILTARHHACESTGSYVLEGVLTGFSEYIPKDTEIFCVPMVDYDGVSDGDQGKNRFPHDHNRDYCNSSPAIYRSVRKIREYSDKNGAELAFDFHSPWHCGGQNDKVFMVQNSQCYKNSVSFSKILEKCSDGGMRYYERDNIAPNTDWNKDSTPCFNGYMSKAKENQLSFSLETPYFGTGDSRFSENGALTLGKCFYKAICEFLKN